MMFAGARTSWARAAPLAQACCSRGAFTPSGLALAARSTSGTVDVGHLSTQALNALLLLRVN